MSNEFEIRTNPTRVRRYNEETGAFGLVSVVYHEVVLGEVVVAEDESPEVAHTTAKLLNTIPVEEAKQIIEAIGRVAAMHATTKRGMRAAPLADPNDRHHIWS